MKLSNPFVSLCLHGLQDLNVDSKFPFPDASFDVVTCVVSVDYLTKPLEVFKEIARVLKPNGKTTKDTSHGIGHEKL
jgi:SAM-dependent methyltransferase